MVAIFGRELFALDKELDNLNQLRFVEISFSSEF